MSDKYTKEHIVIRSLIEMAKSGKFDDLADGICSAMNFTYKDGYYSGKLTSEKEIIETVVNNIRQTRTNSPIVREIEKASGRTNADRFNGRELPECGWTPENNGKGF